MNLSNPQLDSDTPPQDVQSDPDVQNQSQSDISQQGVLSLPKHSDLSQQAIQNLQRHSDTQQPRAHNLKTQRLKEIEAEKEKISQMLHNAGLEESENKIWADIITKINLSRKDLIEFSGSYPPPFNGGIEYFYITSKGTSHGLGSSTIRFRGSYVSYPDAHYPTIYSFQKKNKIKYVFDHLVIDKLKETLYLIYKKENPRGDQQNKNKQLYNVLLDQAHKKFEQEKDKLIPLPFYKLPNFTWCIVLFIGFLGFLAFDIILWIQCSIHNYNDKSDDKKKDIIPIPKGITIILGIFVLFLTLLCFCFFIVMWYFRHIPEEARQIGDIWTLKLSTNQYMI